MKSRKRIVSAVLAMVLLTSLLTGCKESTVSGGVREQEKQNVKAEIPASEYDFIESGTSEYYILIPEDATKNEKFAASELQTFIKEATGVELDVQIENAEEAVGSFLSVGNTKASQKAGVLPSYEALQRGGFLLQTVEDDCYIKGYTDIGTRNGVYEFLYYCFDYECYATDEIVMTETSDLKMPVFELCVTPSFDLREATGGDPVGDEVLAYRMRFNDKDEMFVTGNACHTSFQFINPTIYDFTSETYKDWFSRDLTDHLSFGIQVPSQLCYSNTEMREEYLKNLKDTLKDTDKPFCILGMEDNHGWCTCEACSATIEKYGANSATIIQFCNYMQAEINKWYAEEYPEKEPVMLVIFAYQSSEAAPVYYDEEARNYATLDDSVILNEDSAVMYAPIHANVAYNFSSEVNEDVMRNIDQWNVISSNMLFWVYTVNPGHCLVMCDTYEVIQENYKIMMENDGIHIFDQMAVWQYDGNSGWDRAMTYVQSKLQWNVNLNMEELLDDFFDNYFDVANETMQSLFEQERQWWRHIWADLGGPQTLFGERVLSQYWSKPVIIDWLNQIDKAYEEIEVYKESNPERYQQLYDRITLESLQYRYLLLQLYAADYSDSEAMDMKYAFRRDMERLEVATHKENHDVNELWVEWGISDSN